MSSFGETLRREREKRKVSLDDIAAVTKIGTRNLKALEDENFSILPGGIFNKGFVRAYARFLGLNEERLVADYETACKDQPVSVEKIAEQSAIAKANRLALQQRNESADRGAVIRIAVIGAILIGASFGGYKLFHNGALKALKRPSLHRQLKQQATAPAPTKTVPVAQPQTSSSQPQAAPATAQNTPPPQVVASPTKKAVEVAAAPPKPVAPTPVTPAASTPGASTTPPTANAASVEFTVGIKTSEECWLVVTTDGKRAFQRLFQPNEEQSVTAKNTVKILIGNPGGTEISLNGKPLAISGSLSHPRTVTVGAGGFVDE